MISSRIDRETLAPFGGSGWINFTLVSRDLNYTMFRFSKLVVRMRINDVNDNSPVFSQSVYEVSLIEIIFM